MCRRTIVTVLGLLAFAGVSSASAQQFDPALYESLEWRNVGPARGGRSTAGAGSDARPMEYYFGATGGGLWKSTDGGLNWRPVTDGQITSSSVGAVQVCETNPDIVYIGTGETQIRGNIMQGDGIYKSTDAGETWRHMGLKEAQNISRIRIHPTDCNMIWVAAFGMHSSSNPDRGVFKSNNGGETWRKVLYRDENTGAVDITLDPNNPAVMYAALWEAWRKSWGMSSGGPGSGIFKSVDFGETWTEITRNPGLPQTGLMGKIGIALSPAAPHRVWAIVENDEGGVFRSDDAGATWKRINEERRLRQRAFYYTRIYADPQDPDVMYVLNTGFYRSTDGGETYQSIRVPHGDNHDLWIAPSDPDRMINTNDGGGNVSFNGGQSWTEQDFPTAQFYRVETTNHDPYFICGGQQDNSTACVPSRGWNHVSRGGNYFFAVGGCESGYVANDPKDPAKYYAGCYGGSLSMYNHRNGQGRSVNVWPENPMGQSSEDLVERVQWTFPIVFSPVDPERLYTGTQKLWMTTNEGQSWQQLSDDLTRAAPETVGPSGGPITKDQTGVETYATIFAVAPSFHDVNVIWVGSDDGLVHVTQDHGAAWQNVTPRDAPDFVRINTIEASPTTPGKAYVAGIRYLVDNDRSPYIWRTNDFGQTWTKIVNGIPGDDFIRAVREDPTRPGLLYAASERTVYVSWDDGANWSLLSQNLPVTQVSDIRVKDDDLVISTHGRSFWVMDNIGPLRELNQQIADADVHLFEMTGPVLGLDNGARVSYYLAEGVDTLKLEFLDSRGEVISEHVGTSSDEAPRGGGGGFGGGFGGFGGGNQKPSVDAGSHSFTWNMRYPAWTDFDGRIFWGARPMGPRAVPGRYQVRLTAGDIVQTHDFEITMDPRWEGVTVAQLQERFDMAMAVRDRVTEANEAVIQIREVKTEVDDRLEKTDDDGIEEQGGVVKMKMGEVEQEIYQVRNESNQDPLNFPIKLNNKIAALLGHVEGGEGEPTEQAQEVYQYLSGLLQVELDRLQVIIETDLRRLNELLTDNGLDPILIRTSNTAAGVSP